MNSQSLSVTSLDLSELSSELSGVEIKWQKLRDVNECSFCGSAFLHAQRKVRFVKFFSFFSIKAYGFYSVTVGDVEKFPVDDVCSLVNLSVRKILVHHYFAETVLTPQKLCRRRCEIHIAFVLHSRIWIVQCDLIFVTFFVSAALGF